MASIEINKYIQLLHYLGVKIEDNLNQYRLKELKELVLEAFDSVSGKLQRYYTKWVDEHKINVRKTIDEDTIEINDYIKIINESSTKEDVIQNAIYQLKLVIELIERLGEYKKRRNNNIARGPRSITQKKPRGFGEVTYSAAEPNVRVLDPSVIANRKRESIYYRVNTPGMNNFRTFGSQTQRKRTGKLRPNITAYTAAEEFKNIKNIRRKAISNRRAAEAAAAAAAAETRVNKRNRGPNTNAPNTKRGRFNTLKNRKPSSGHKAD